MNSTLVHDDITESSIWQESDIIRQIKGPACS